MPAFNFNAENVAPAVPFEPIPADNYNVMAVASEVKTTKAGDGEYIKFTFQVIDGQYKDRKLFANINVRNPSSEAERIGQSQLSAMCHATRVMHLSDTEQLHNKPLTVKVVIDKNEGGSGGPQNAVKGYFAFGGTAPAPTPGAPTPSKTPARPWDKKAA